MHSGPGTNQPGRPARPKGPSRARWWLDRRRQVGQLGAEGLPAQPHRPVRRRARRALDVAAALDQGTRLFLLQARYQDAGNGQADYYLAGPQGVSHRPLRELFAPLGEWLAAPGHEHEMVRLGLRTDPRSANPARFDAACQAFTSTLGQYLLKATDLPAGKSLAELTRGEQAALQSQPRVITNWSACTGGEPPIRRPQAEPAPAVPVEDHWMADQKDGIGQRPLRQVVIPGSHDAATYDDSSCPYGLDGQHECWPGGPIEADYTQAQSQDVTAQLNAGSRYLDLRFSYDDQAGYGGKDFYNYHGDINGNPNASYLKMSKVLIDIVSWINQPGREREIVWLDLRLYHEDQDPSQSKAICDATLGWQLAQGKVFQSSMLPPNTALTDMSMNEIWALPGHPQIIVTGWSSCTGDDPMTTGAAYANACSAQYIWDTIYPELDARKDWMSGRPVSGAYNLFVQGTPFGSNGPTCATGVFGLAPQQEWPLYELKLLNPFSNPKDRPPRANLNFVAGDFLGDPAGEEGWPIVGTALLLNLESSIPVALSWTNGPGRSVTASCNVGIGPTTMVVYPVVQGPQSPNLKTFTAGQGSPGVQGSVSLSDFPGAGPAPDGSYLVAACARWGSPLDSPGSASGAQISRIVIPFSPFIPVPWLVATPAGPVDLPFNCSAPGTAPIQVTAYPAGRQLSPDAQVFSGNGTVQGTYRRQGSYDVTLECAAGNALTMLPVADSAFPPALTLRTNPKDRWLYCDRSPQVQLKSPFVLELAALTPHAPDLEVSGAPDRRTIVLTIKPNIFPPGDYLLTATCASNVSNDPELPWKATPLVLSSSQIPTLEVLAEITGCSAQVGKPYACALQVTLGEPVTVDTVLSVNIGGSEFANPSDGDRPQVAAHDGCPNAPLPSPYLTDKNGSYTRYDVNISPGGCTGGAVLTFRELVTGPGGAPISQQVTVPGLGVGNGIIVLPSPP
jgi:hypothetical protein